MRLGFCYSSGVGVRNIGIKKATPDYSSVASLNQVTEISIL